MSNRIKIKHKTKQKEKHDIDQVKTAKFMKGNREKGTIASNYSGKSSKEYSRKKV